MTSSFRRAPCTNLSISKNSAAMQRVSNLLQVLQKSLIKSLRKSNFKALYERSNEQSLSQTTLWLNCYSKKIGKNPVHRHLVRIIDQDKNSNIFQKTRFNHTMVFFKLIIDQYNPHDIYVSRNNCRRHMLITQYYQLRYKVCHKEMK